MATISGAAIEKATGRTRAQWFAVLDELGARDMAHKEIAQTLEQRKLIEDAWWCQTVTVEYERHIGRRAEGQLSSGAFSVSASKTFAAADLDAALAAWCAAIGTPEAYDGVAAERPAQVSTSEAWRYWRVKLADGSGATVAISMKATGKATASVSHDGLPDGDVTTSRKAYWKSVLARLG
ncbi:MAG: hypothetical protein EA426_15345 [Spirochaetaceae bacterium]|nr:MAG: hypothetical protein EA426_15345 [Spirochaetaceae bacterium]